MLLQLHARNGHDKSVAAYVRLPDSYRWSLARHNILSCGNPPLASCLRAIFALQHVNHYTEPHKYCVTLIALLTCQSLQRSQTAFLALCRCRSLITASCGFEESPHHDGGTF